MLFGRNGISRRKVLRGMIAGGASVVVPLPRLGAMLNGNGTAYADGTKLPVRFGFWFFGNGIIPSRWVPNATGIGDAWTLSEELEPLLAVKPWLSVVTGMDVKVPDSAAHASFPACALSGATNGTKTTLLPTIDQVIGKMIGTGTTFGVNGLHIGIGSSSGSTALGDVMSFSAQGQPNPPEFSPANLFKKLFPFASTTSGAAPAAPDPDLLRRQMVLDAVNTEAAALRTKLGAEDQQRLDRHLQGVQELQTQIMRAQGPKVVGKLVDPDMGYPNRGADGSLSRARCEAFNELLVFALSTDLTRIFSYTFTTPASFQSYADCGLGTGGYHGDYGHRQSPKGAAYATAGMNTGVRYAMSNLADLLTKMKNTADGASTLLDNSAVYTTSCTSESQTHSPIDFPLLVSGKAGGKLKGDQHIRIVGENTTTVLHTLYQAYGGTDQTFGMGAGQVGNGLTALLT
ncbi:MAG TPA: DUF1552 domain-containing protein [Polyangia bacterium]|jgi:hypothetical protein|nr:DUF1552 domain-containing protein [Polyangia bacterium]